MSAQPGRRSRANHARKDMHRAVSRRVRRRELWMREGEGSTWQSLSMIGALGWITIAPPLLGALVGRWLDRALGTGILFSAALISLGIALGAYLAWRRVFRE